MSSRISLALLVALAACHDVEMYPVGSGTGGTGGGTTPDAAVADAIGEGSTIHGRVCLINDARSPTSCASTGAADLTVSLGSATATTAADGSFTITATSSTGLVWRVTGTGIQASAMQVSAVATIPAISKVIFDDMVTSANAIVGDGTGSVIARFTIGTSGVSGLVAATAPTAEGLVYYDGTSAVEWQTNSTGSFGVVWVPGLAPGTVQLTVGGSHDQTVTGVPVYADTVTFVLAAIQ